MASAALPPAPASQEAFETAFRAHIADIKAMGANVPYADSVARFRKLLQSGILRLTDIRDNPERFLAAHRMLAEFATSLGPGFWIRFTVHFNLFAGTVMALGTKEQVAQLDAVQQAGKVGCFGLTEVFAGVNSGLVVNTTATWNPDKQQFLIHCPDQGAHKNWISQGLCADVGVVVADLRVAGKSHGPHAFFMEVRRNGKLVEGVEMGDMGVKTIGNDLDNAWISFKNVWIPKDALLSRYGYMEGNAYVQRQKGIRTMDMIGQRLFTGRAVIARSSLVFTRMLYASTREYTDKKLCWAPQGASVMLSQIPQLGALFTEADQKLTSVEGSLARIEQQLADCLRTEKIPPADLVEAIASGKVKCVELAIDLCWRLKQEVGSYALMTGCGFEQLDYLQCCKFAEGDSRILMLKISRDRVKSYQKGNKGPANEATLCESILEAGKKKDPMLEHAKIYELAHAVVERSIQSFSTQSSKL